MDVVLADHQVARYIDGWGRSGDRAVVDEDRHGTLIGAAWYRLFPEQEQGYGFLGEHIPELSVAVLPWRRGEGIGTRLLAALIDRAQENGYPALSLSVERDNLAVWLYRKLGFEDAVAAGDTLTMVRRLDTRQRAGS
jgi:ribosomal protein S18 acetylase RimI-like enzyme